MIFIGDVHGNLNKYEEILNKTKSLESVQVGDFGVGFSNYKTKPVYINNFFKDLNGNHRFIRGNHDNPKECLNCSNYIKDGTVEGNTMYIGGAISIDKNYRVEGLDWWPDEELNYGEFMRYLEVYEKNKPEIMVTHDCPEFLPKNFGLNIFEEKSITRKAFDQFFEIHQPKYWIFGHWHISYKGIHNGTTFICLNINEWIEL